MKIVWPNSLRIGFHLSIAAGPKVLFERYSVRGCQALQIFVGSPRIWATKAWKQNIVDQFKDERLAAGNPPLIVHTRYLANLASANPEVRKKAVEIIRFEYLMAASLDADLVVVHMGSNPDRDEGLRFMKENLKASLRGIAEKKPLLLLENTAGERNDLGADLEEIARVQESVEFPIGLCFDTCHGFQAGFDLRSETSRDEVITRLRNLFGNDGVRLIHLNDSMQPFDSHHDRHEDVGLGQIGAEALGAFLLAPSFEGLPVIMETPQSGNEDPAADLANLERLRKAFTK
ncbi:MAG: deoxyribonuclease IV [Candidatus Riflebacteria bacterium]|nr:deoxyribonuclease IV [Candidatus Riflebacteria bacterium]